MKQLIMLSTILVVGASCHTETMESAIQEANRDCAKYSTTRGLLASGQSLPLSRNFNFKSAFRSACKMGVEFAVHLNDRYVTRRLGKVSLGERDADEQKEEGYASTDTMDLCEMLTVDNFKYRPFWGEEKLKKILQGVFLKNDSSEEDEAELQIFLKEYKEFKKTVLTLEEDRLFLSVERPDPKVKERPADFENDKTIMRVYNSRVALLERLRRACNLGAGAGLRQVTD